MDGWMDGWLDGWMNGWQAGRDIESRMDQWMMHRWVHGQMGG